ASGYYDLATPYLATDYTLNHLDLEPDLQQNIAVAHYAAGHMMYIHQPSLAQLKADLAAFIATALPEPPAQA
nr:peptidase S10 [Herpetosiphonaceae bacterium]